MNSVFSLAQLKTSGKTQLPRIEFPSDTKKLAVCLGGYNVSLEEEQCYLNRCGMVHLIIKLIKTSPSQNVFLEVIQLAVAMLNGGNADVQVSCFYASERNKLKHDLEIVHLFFTISGLHTYAMLSRDCTLCLHSLTIRMQFLDSENAQRNLEIMQILRLCGTHICIHMYTRIILIPCMHT